jgi:hypothetical protein
MSGEMAKVIVQNALFDDSWKLTALLCQLWCTHSPSMPQLALVQKK